MLHNNRAEPYKEKFGQRFLIKCESINFRLQAPIDGEKGPLGQVIATLTVIEIYFHHFTLRTGGALFDIHGTLRRPSQQENHRRFSL
jgi:hypothetical protein